MDLDASIARLATNADAFRSLTQHVTAEQARWKPSPEEWSILEVVNHLVDEEREDLRTRLNLTLHQPGRAWPSVDPAAWVDERGYNQRDLESSVTNLLAERQNSITWLKSLSAPNWDLDYQHPMFGTIRAGDLMAAWLAHDFLHIRQLARLHWQYLATTSAPYKTDYAGSW